MIRGHGLYRFDTILSSSQEVGQDVVTLLIGIPLLITGIAFSRQGSLRGHLLLTRALGYFLYTYGAMSFLTVFNPLFLVYVALFSLALFGFVICMSHLDADEVARHFSDGFPRRTVACYFTIVGVFLTLAWLGLAASPSLTWTPPAGLESGITLVIQAIDLGVIVPTSLMTATLLMKKRAWGYLLSSVMLLKILTMGSALIAMIIGQVMAGVKVDPLTSLIFIVISLAGIFLGVATLRNVQEFVSTNPSKSLLEFEPHRSPL